MSEERERNKEREASSVHEKNSSSWMRLPREYTGDSARFLILPIPYEYEPTYGAGASKGAAAIIKASEHLEYYDEQFGTEPFLKGICEEEPLKVQKLKPEIAVEAIAEKVKGLDKDRFIISLGGDHAVTIGIVKGLEAVEKNFSVLILDAHSDFRYSQGGQYNHACVARRIVGNHRVGIIGVRAQDVDEAEEVEKNKNVRILKSYDYSEEEVEEILAFLGGKVYLSIDVDVFDFIRNTGTPEPGGLSWNQAINILEKLFLRKKVIGADIVEFAPRGEEWNYRPEAFALAKLAYKIMGLSTRS